MTHEQKNEALLILGLGVAKTIENYTENALLTNSCFIAADRYASLTTTNGLSTTLNIPIELRLDNEVDVQFTNEELVSKYTSDVLNIIYRNYLIASISLVDATLEDLYEYFIQMIDPNISDLDLEKHIRNSWTNDNLLNFFIDPGKVNLKKPESMNMGFVEAFIRYYELRIVRHTLLHSSGKLSDKNLSKLQLYLDNTPVERQGFALIKVPIFDAEWKINLTINHVLSIRKYLDRFLMYIFKSVGECETLPA
ncbi:hypothetical protein GO755_26400 [Spirosoma sp. HMF4905]|uniref:Uncharacterized protein n=1 Tax=Spirosoma arboris TaxID=2682092 RepID=A0A7K1SIE8_9BACT|nr:hypothetical protein [Spirosoma arboris]MVM33597.1 hypothetical protein [Spirosoma arboris]